ncbi:hypothetical protein EHQ52_03945 [Leptospira koniambonensis]|uniref:Anti-bacteriophage protein A/HamA C-terminal domain-containing protein n=1 Tax=Leptospira koniambonensis TaxID=2484950 RepID=A0A4R9JA51_9LEPT|nr:hypothetical protein [Leptospira koniambonensis]TGL35927.1 hypothetical protein EHQ52_03945 [Leptospira koniambonensis]
MYSLKDNKHEEFIKSIFERFRLSYISDEELKDKAQLNQISPSEFLKEYILPDKGSIKSGDFGEICSFLLTSERSKQKKKSVNGPLKWRWKDKNKASPHTDAILFYRKNPKKATEEDFLISIESKMKATNKKKRHRIQEAVDGAADDKIFRLALTLKWLERKYAKEGNVKEKLLLERYQNPAKNGIYDIKYKAFAFIDKNFLDEEVNKVIDNKHNITVVVFSIGKLQEIYEKTFELILKEMNV